MRFFHRQTFAACALTFTFFAPCQAADWSRFRGDNGSGVTTDAKDLPSQFDDKANLQWKVALPGPGSSCPIIVGDRVFVTCWSGYGTAEAPEGTQEDLKRHLVCLDRISGKVLWDKSVKAALPEDTYEGMFAEHGYASHTPVSDGKNVFVFYGKSGVHAYDLEGNELWNREVGSGLDQRRWGSSCSPIVFENLVIVLAAAESQTLFAFDKETGKEVWKEKADGFAGTWGTPILVTPENGETELVVGVPFEVWAFDPKTGKFKWYCPIPDTDSYCSSVVADKGIIYSVEGRNGGGVAIRAGGKDDVSKTHVVWQGTLRNRIGTPLIANDLMYFFGGRVANCVKTSDGEEVFQSRLPTAESANAAASSEGPGPGGPSQGGPRGGGRGQGGRGGRGGGMGGQDYSSPVAADGKIYFVTRNGDIHVLKLGDKFESLAVNRLTSESEDFSATPAIAGNQIFIRSSKHMYCVGKKD
jgi:outer membrane protein assembly factor BamB